MSDASRPDLEALAHELVLRINFAKVMPTWGLGVASRDGWVVRDLLRDVAVLLLVRYILERLALSNGKFSNDMMRRQKRAYKHGIKRLSNAADSRRVVGHGERSDKRNTAELVWLLGSRVHCKPSVSVLQREREMVHLQHSENSISSAIRCNMLVGSLKNTGNEIFVRSLPMLCLRTPVI